MFFFIKTPNFSMGGNYPFMHKKTRGELVFIQFWFLRIEVVKNIKTHSDF